MVPTKIAENNSESNNDYGDDYEEYDDEDDVDDGGDEDDYGENGDDIATFSQIHISTTIMVYVCGSCSGGYAYHS